MRLGLCQRSGDILEPVITPQWYVSCEGMAKRAADAAREKTLTILPAEHEKTWYYWLDNIKDWCVSCHAIMNAIPASSTAMRLPLPFKSPTFSSFP